MATIANANVSGNIAIRGVDGKYMKVTSTNGLEFGNQKLDDTAKFEVEKFDNGKVSLKGNSSRRNLRIPPSFSSSVLQARTARS